MKAEKIIRLRMQNSTFCRRIPVVQGDTARTFRFILEDITLDGTEHARIYARKPSGTEIYDECDVIGSNEVIFTPETEQIFIETGIISAEIRVAKGEKLITSYSFEFEVRQSTMRTGDIPSSDEFNALERAIEEAKGLHEPEFTEAGKRENIVSGETMQILFGKIKKWFTDLGALIIKIGNKDISSIGDGTVTGAITDLDKRSTKNTSDIDVERKRIDNIAKLPEGSTAGDAELADIRVAADGTVYDTAGESVRGQTNQIDQKYEKETGSLGDKTKNLKYWNIADISKAKQGYAYWSTVGKSLEQVESANYTLLDEVYEVEAGKQYTVNWLYGNLGIYDNADKIISANYIDSIPFTVTIPDDGVKMTLFGDPKRMVDIMLVEGNEIPDEYIPHSIFDIESKKDHEQDKILESILHPLKGVKWCAYGDSLTDSATLASQTTGTKNYVDYTSESLGLNVVNCGSAGTGFLNKNGNKGNFVDRVTSIPLDTEILTVFGSFNDYEYITKNLGTLGDTGTDTIYGAIYNFIHNVYERCPKVIMGIITPTKWGYLSEWKDVHAGSLCDLYVEALLKTADKWSIPVLDLYHDSGLRPWNSNFAQTYYKDDDGNGVANTVHPLDAAHKRFIAPKVEAFIKRIYHVY